MQRIIICILLLGSFARLAEGSDTEAQKLLDQSEQSLAKLKSFKVNYRAFQEHVSGAPELGMAGSLTFQSGNRFYFSNAGTFFIFDGQMECVSDGTNYLGIIAPRTIQWERKSVRPNFNKFLMRSFIVGGATPIVASQLVAAQAQDEQNSVAKPLPFLTNQFSTSNGRFVGEEALEGKASKRIELAFSGTNAPAKMDLWFDKTTLLPIKRISHDRSSGDVIETYTYELNPNISSDTFSPYRIIKNRKLESAIQQMEMPNGLLLKASRTGDIKLAADSLANGANPNTKTSLRDIPPSFTPLMFAAKSGNLELVKLLVEHGAEINTGASTGRPPLQFACMAGKTEIANYLIEHGASVTNATASLCWAAWRGYSNVVVLLVEKGVPVNQSAGELGTPLQRAKEGGFVDIASYLIKHGAAVNKSK